MTIKLPHSVVFVTNVIHTKSPVLGKTDTLERTILYVAESQMTLIARGADRIILLWETGHPSEKGREFIQRCDEYRTKVDVGYDNVVPHRPRGVSELIPPSNSRAIS